MGGNPAEKPQTARERAPSYAVDIDGRDVITLAER